MSDADRRDPAMAGAMFVVHVPGARPTTGAIATQQKAIIAAAFADLGWHAPQLLAGLPAATELYFDSISRVDVDRWSAGRVALLGDAGYGATVGGMGTSTAVVAAYLLAGELATSGGDYRAAFQRYEAQLRKPVAKTQSGGNRTGKFLAPGTRFGIAARNRLLSQPFLLRQMLRLGEKVSNLVALPNYSASSGRVCRNDSQESGNHPGTPSTAR